MINLIEDNKGKIFYKFLHDEIPDEEILQLMLNVFNSSSENKDEATIEDNIYKPKPPKHGDINSYGQCLLKKKRKRQDSIHEKENTRTNNSNIKIEIKKENFVTQTKTNDKTLKSNKEGNNSIESKEGIKIPSYRTDYYKKAFKVNCFKYLTKTLNEFINKFCKELSRKKFHKPNHQSFTSNVKEEDNLSFLNMELKEAFTYYIKEDRKIQGIKKQKANEKLIKEIFNLQILSSPNLKKLKDFLDMKVEKCIKLYYQSDSFKDFSKVEKIQYYDSKFREEKGFSMLEENGFINLIKLYQNKNDNFSDGLSSIQLVLDGTNSV